MSQFALSIDLPATYEPAQFTVSGPNQLAYSWLLRWPDWSYPGVYIYGEQGAGKTHLAHIWKEKAGAMFIAPEIGELPSTPVIIDGIEQWQDNRQLFHALNHCVLQSQSILITAQQPPDKLGIDLPDVLSRLKLLPQLEITPPDDVLLEAILCKQLSDRQLKITPDVIAYLMPRLPRSYTALAKTVIQLDNASMSEQRMLTIPFIKQTLGW